MRVWATRAVGWLFPNQLIPASLSMCRFGPPHARCHSVYKLPPVCLYICVSSIYREHNRPSCHASVSRCRAGPLYRLRAWSWWCGLPCSFCNTTLRSLGLLSGPSSPITAACGALLLCMWVHDPCRNAWNVTSACHHYLYASPRTRTGQFFSCHLNYDLLLHEAITVILLCNFLK